MKKLIFVLAAACTILAGCSGDEPKQGGETDVPENGGTPEETVVMPVPELTPAETLAAKGQTAFGADFFATVSREYPRQNVMTSPMSASMLLSMFANAADATTRDQICKLLGCADIDVLNSFSGKYMTWLPGADEGITMSLANSLWYKQEYTLNPAFDKVAKEYYTSETLGRDFSKKASLIDEINKWTDLKTRGIIERILDKIDPKAVAVQVNALYFKAAWRDKFNAKATSKGDFRGTDGKVKVDMMNKTDDFRYASTESFEAIELPYGGYGKCSMVIILPKGGRSLDDFIASDDFRNAATTATEFKYIDLSMPKFSIRPSEEIFLNPVLESMGVENIESMNKWSLFTESIDAELTVYQKSGITVDEYGTEAAAATWSGWATSPGPGFEPPTPVKVSIDRPFAFLIKEKISGLCLFAGKVNNL